MAHLHLAEEEGVLCNCNTSGGGPSIKNRGLILQSREHPFCALALQSCNGHPPGEASLGGKGMTRKCTLQNFNLLSCHYIQFLHCVHTPCL